MFTQALQNAATLALTMEPRSRLAFASDNIATTKTNMEAANGRIVDADIAEENPNGLVQRGSGLGVHARPSQLVHRYRADANSLNKTPQK